MKRFILIFVSLILALNGNANSENITLNCDLKKFFTKKNYISEKIQKPLNQVDSTYLNTEFIILDFDKQQIINSSAVMWLADYKEITFNDDYILFKGFGPETEDYFYTDSILSRYTGELRQVTKVSNSVAKSKPEQGGYESEKIYQCVKTEKKF
jgi:hypothetical protein